VKQAKRDEALAKALKVAAKGDCDDTPERKKSKKKKKKQRKKSSSSSSSVSLTSSACDCTSSSHDKKKKKKREKKGSSGKHEVRKNSTAESLRVKRGRTDDEPVPATPRQKQKHTDVPHEELAAAIQAKREAVAARVASEALRFLR